MSYEGALSHGRNRAQQEPGIKPEEIADVQERSIAGAGVYAGVVTMEYWIKKA